MNQPLFIAGVGLSAAWYYFFISAKDTPPPPPPTVADDGTLQVAGGARADGYSFGQIGSNISVSDKTTDTLASLIALVTGDGVEGSARYLNGDAVLEINRFARTVITPVKTDSEWQGLLYSPHPEDLVLVPQNHSLTSYMALQGWHIGHSGGGCWVRVVSRAANFSLDNPASYIFTV